MSSMGIPQCVNLSKAIASELFRASPGMAFLGDLQFVQLMKLFVVAIIVMGITLKVSHKHVKRLKQKEAVSCTSAVHDMHMPPFYYEMYQTQVFLS